VRKPLTLIVITALVAVTAILVVAACSPGGSDENAAAATPKPFVSPSAQPAKVPKRPPVVLMVFDEFPSDSLLGPNRRIDPVRFPNLARLAASADWFPNATTFYDSTPKAVPEILDGRKPFKGDPPTRQGHPRSIFDMFHRKGYGIVDSEQATALCPTRYCRGANKHRPAILKNLRRDRLANFTAWLKQIGRTKRPTAYIKHALLPHGPYMYLPSGARTRNTARDPIPGMNSPPGFGDRFLTYHNYQRYLLQTSFVDRQIGRVIHRLRRAGIYDQALIAVVADHGMSFRVGVKDRRKVNQRNLDEIGPVPFFIKAPGQRKASIQRQIVRTVDMTPTIADILNFKLPYRTFGHSAFSRVTKRRRTVALPNRSFTRTVRTSAKRYEARRRAQVRKRLRLFGSGAFASLYTGIGPNRELIGKRVATLRPLGLGKVRVRLVSGRRVHNVRRRSGLVPAEVAGAIRGGKRGAHRDVAVTVNGVIQAVGRSFYLKGSRTESMAVMIPEESLREGNNSVEVYAVGKGRKLRLIARS
jgi:hypothetical protein